MVQYAQYPHENQIRRGSLCTVCFKDFTTASDIMRLSISTLAFDNPRLGFEGRITHSGGKKRAILTVCNYPANIQISATGGQTVAVQAQIQVGDASVDTGCQCRHHVMVKSDRKSASHS